MVVHFSILIPFHIFLPYSLFDCLFVCVTRHSEYSIRTRSPSPPFHSEHRVWITFWHGNLNPGDTRISPAAGCVCGSIPGPAECIIALAHAPWELTTVCAWKKKCIKQPYVIQSRTTLVYSLQLLLFRTFKAGEWRHESDEQTLGLRKTNWPVFLKHFFETKTSSTYSLHFCQNTLMFLTLAGFHASNLH